MIELTLPAMSCAHCVRTITETIHRLDPAAEVQCDPGTHRARIETTLSREQLAAALAGEGYPAA